MESSKSKTLLETAAEMCGENESVFTVYTDSDCSLVNVQGSGRDIAFALQRLFECGLQEDASEEQRNTLNLFLNAMCNVLKRGDELSRMLLTAFEEIVSEAERHILKTQVAPNNGDSIQMLRELIDYAIDTLQQCIEHTKNKKNKNKSKSNGKRK